MIKLSSIQWEGGDICLTFKNATQFKYSESYFVLGGTADILHLGYRNSADGRVEKQKKEKSHRN